MKHTTGSVNPGAHVRSLRGACRARGIRMRWYEQRLDLYAGGQTVSAYTDTEVEALTNRIKGGDWPFRNPRK